MSRTATSVWPQSSGSRARNTSTGGHSPRRQAAAISSTNRAPGSEGALDRDSARGVVGPSDGVRALPQSSGGMATVAPSKFFRRSTPGPSLVRPGPQASYPELLGSSALRAEHVPPLVGQPPCQVIEDATDAAFVQ